MLDSQRNLADASDRFVHARLDISLDKHRGLENFPTGGWRLFAEGSAGTAQGVISGYAALEAASDRHIWPRASRLGWPLAIPISDFMGGTEGWIAPPWLIGRRMRETQDNNLPFDLYTTHFTQSMSGARLLVFLPK
ncbi:MAG: hypothetical protein R3B47_16160 [Bacteroidia bacterium]